jgi:hypothetical protein
VILDDQLGSAGGIGGCPFSPGAPGNVATELIVEYLEDRGIPTGIDSGAIHAAFRRHIAQMETIETPDIRAEQNGA